MAKITRRSAGRGARVPIPMSGEPLRISVVGLSLGLFLAISYVLCVGFDLIFPSREMYQIWLRLLPGFSWLTFPSFLLGLIETFAWGWYVALIFCPLFNFFAARVRL